MSEYTQELIKPVLVDGRGYSKSDRVQTAQLLESVTVRITEDEHSDEDTASMSEFNTLELIKLVPIGRCGYSKSEIRSSTTTTEVIPVQCSPPRPKHSFRDHIRSGLLDSKLKAVGFERSGDTQADGNCRIHGKLYYLSSG